MIKRSTIGINEAVETLTGLEENEIQRRFGSDVGDLLENRPTMGIRAVAYVLNLRELKKADVKDPEAKAYGVVMNMTIKQAADFFPDEVGEIDDDEPETPAGEGGASAG